MKIAVTYENGNVFQHFGKTETFKVYDVEDNKVVSSEIIGSNGSGHGALAGLLAGENIDVLICGGIGGGAQAALAQAGIELCAGAQGNTDEAVEAYLKGELVNSGVNCDHHHHDDGQPCGDHGCGHHDHEETEEHECHCHDKEAEGEEHECHCHDNADGEEHECHCHDEGEEGCGGGCGGGCGCHAPQFDGKNVGRTMRVHYKGTFNDGTQFDSSYDRGEPLEFTCGAGQMILGFDKAVANMEVGEETDIHLMPEEAYGMPDPRAVFTVEIANLPGSENLTVGQHVYLTNQFGQPFPVTVTDKGTATITFDANHEMAGKELNFHIEIVEIQ